MKSIIYIYTIVAFLLKWYQAPFMEHFSWWWIIAPFWVITLGPKIFRYIFIKSYGR